MMLPGRGFLGGTSSGFLGAAAGAGGIPGSLLEFGNVEIWYNAKRGGGTPAGSGIGTIPDLGLAGRNLTQTDDTRRPTLGSINGNPGWLFDGTNDCIDNPNLNVTFSIAAVTLLLVVTPTTVANSNNDAFRLRTADNNNRFSFRRNTDGGNLFYDSAAGTDLNLTVPAATFAANATRFVIGRFQPGTNLCNFITSNGVSGVGTGPADPATAIDQIHFGGQEGAVPWTGYIHELGVLSKVFSDLEHSRLVLWADQEWILN